MLRADRIQRSFSPIYLAILSGIILIILIINGLLEINRTEKGFYLLLEREASVQLEYLEKNIQEAMKSLRLLEDAPHESFSNPALSGFLFSLEESVAEYLVDAAHRVDQMDGEKSLDTPDLESLAHQYLISSVEFYDPKGTLVKSWPSPPYPLHTQSLLRQLVTREKSVVVDLFGKSLAGEGQWFSVALWRKVTPGVIVLHIDTDHMKKFLRQFAIQRAISDLGQREGVLFVSALDDQFMTLAHTDTAFVGRKEEDPFLRNSLQSSGISTRLYQPDKGEEVLEISKSFPLNHGSKGLLLIGYSPKEIHPVLTQIKKNVALSILFFLIFGVLAITWIWVNQNRHLKKVKQMEDRIQLAERLSSLGHLAAGVAHEIRNPLNAIGMGLQRLRREFTPQEKTKQEEYLSFTELILKEIRRVNEIVEQFLSLARPYQLELKEGSLQEVLRNVALLFEEEASSQNIGLQAEISSNLPLVKMDAPRLTQAFINIMKNGMQAMERGGVLRIESASRRDRVEVVITDSGAGIPPDQMEKIFDYYYTTKEKGVGLGLPIAHRIIEAHGGQLKIDSQLGSGTKVTVTLPVQRGVEG